MNRLARHRVFVIAPALMVVLVFALGALGAAPAWADKCNPDGQSETGQFHVEEQDGQKVYVIDKAITVCGKVPRPLVAYVLQPRNINYEFEGMKQEFLPKIRESVKKAPF
jgi:hypothetical protein